MECWEVTSVVKAGNRECCRGENPPVNPLCLVGEKKVVLAAAFCRTEVTEGWGPWNQHPDWALGHGESAVLWGTEGAVKSKRCLKILLDFCHQWMVGCWVKSPDAFSVYPVPTASRGCTPTWGRSLMCQHWHDVLGFGLHEFCRSEVAGAIQVLTLLIQIWSPTVVSSKHILNWMFPANFIFFANQAGSLPVLCETEGAKQPWAKTREVTV